MCRRRGVSHGPSVGLTCPVPICDSCPHSRLSSTSANGVHLRDFRPIRTSRPHLGFRSLSQE
ncbi:hypothetical protein HMPREF0321_0082 [Dermacoccus sp. Ellin185]|nr:hypothetical protein HMPREF0321_0082 [Dermacoccus sp. Ellin185]